MTSGRSTTADAVLSAVWKATIAGMSAAARYALTVALTATGIVLLWVGLAAAEPLAIPVGLALTLVAGGLLVYSSATLTWLRERRRGRGWS
ncbi:MAG: hypothetical protein ABEJ35_04490 [Halobacteriaceae archaeon]